MMKGSVEMCVKKEAVEVRKKLVDRLRYEMVGPSSEKELISSKPLQKYLAGILWPMKSNIVTTEDENDAAMQGKDVDKETIESVAPLANAMNPSAIGMSFLVDIGSPLLAVDISLGMYIEKGDRVWERVPYGLTKETINLAEEIGIKRIKVIPKLNIHNEVQTQGTVQLEWITRRYHNCYAVSMFIVNRHTQETDEHDVDSKCLFQPKITIESLGSPSIMVRNAFSNNEKGFQDEDTKTNELLYRDESAYGVGHSIAVHWSKVDKHQKKAGRLETEVIPDYEIPMVIPPRWNQGGTLDMKELGNMLTAKEVEQALLPLLEAYGEWIKERKGEIDDLEDHKETAIQHMKKCDASLKRMYEGLAILKHNENAFASFIFANQVMSNQRVHTVVAEGGSERIEDVESIWRPFQIAFFLQNLKGTVDPTSEDRQIADLLWFPTGGGKTEAYLGLAAFTLGYRRLTYSNDFRTDAGVSVIMRYTLRLLTVQQFQRATAMICACEEIRRANPDKWGTRPYRIGLWVGKASAPNNYDDAKKVIQSKIKAGMNKSESINIDLSNGTPIQFVSCPWCGSKMVDDKKPTTFQKAYKNKNSKRRIQIYCVNEKCSFNKKNSNDEGLPVLITDEEIYRLLPDLVIGTVDKFARMPWQPEVQNLFGKVKGEVEGWGFISNGESTEQNFAKNVAGHLNISDSTPVHPPNLIIQDELHLISGPLGTMVGLYETAIDYLSSVEEDGTRIGPKIVASTATIRNADKQIAGLYTRKTQIFPSPGISHADSFFAQQRDLTEEPGRMYVGLFAPGRSMKTLLLRVYANLLASVSNMEEQHATRALDPYYTLVGYFNSLRELGGAVRLIEDDVPARMRTLENQHGEEESYQFTQRVLERDVPELTSRINSSEIPSILDKLQQPYYKKNDKGLTPIDVLLASNMISVGVDVSRLGLMAVNGQPKTTAEYIQSTSRVGRKFPGLVITSYNWARPRDISHYEEFYAYHSALYQYVEPISVTPFASRARDRGMAAVLVSMIRLNNPEFTSDGSASMPFEHDGLFEEVTKVFLERAKKMGLTPAAIQKHLDELIKAWENDADKSRLNYNNSSKNETETNLLYPIGSSKQGGTFKTPNSMRDVEPTAGIYIKK